MQEEKISEDELKQAILATIQTVDCSGIGIVNLGGFQFDRIPCSRRKLYALAKKFASEWGYEYKGSEYHPSGNPAFKRNHKRGRYSAPYLFKV